MLRKEQIQAAKDRPREWVAVPEWTPEGETFDSAVHGVWVGTMSAKDRDSWEQGVYWKKSEDEKSNLENLRTLLAIYSVQDETGTRLFDATDVTWLAEKAGTALTGIFDVAMRLNKLRKKDTDELTKN